MYGEKLLDHFRNPRCAGELDAPARTVRVENPGCGDVLQLSLRLENGFIREARFKAQGCPPTIACGSALAEWLQGRTCQEARSMDPDGLEQMLGGLPPASRHAAALAVEALRKLMRDA
jgi:nitrogen fixation NifU-like protein